MATMTTETSFRRHLAISTESPPPPPPCPSLLLSSCTPSFSSLRMSLLFRFVTTLMLLVPAHALANDVVLEASFFDQEPRQEDRNGTTEEAAALEQAGVDIANRAAVAKNIERADAYRNLPYELCVQDRSFTLASLADSGVGNVDIAYHRLYLKPLPPKEEQQRDRRDVQDKKRTTPTAAAAATSSTSNSENKQESVMVLFETIADDRDTNKDRDAAVGSTGPRRRRRHLKLAVTMVQFVERADAVVDKLSFAIFQNKLVGFLRERIDDERQEGSDDVRSASDTDAMLRNVKQEIKRAYYHPDDSKDGRDGRVRSNHPNDDSRSREKEESSSSSSSPPPYCLPVVQHCSTGRFDVVVAGAS